MAISLKDEYRTQIIPLAAAAGAEYTALYILRDAAVGDNPGEDGSFMDFDVQAFINYDAGQGYNQQWWTRFADFLDQCKTYEIKPIVTLYDFCCSGAGPFGEYASFDLDDGDYVSRVVQYLNTAGVDYIINIGCEHGAESTSFINDCISHLMSLGVSLSEQMCLNDDVLDAHYAANDITHIPGYVTQHKGYIPGGTSGHGRWSGDAAHTINDEEDVGGGGYPVQCNGSWGSGWGGSSTKQQYIDYLNAASDGIACMNFWHLKAFNNCTDAAGGEDMNAIFAPNQRAAMIEVFGPFDPPQKATDPGPAHLAAGVCITTDLSWAAGAGATSHDVYFGPGDPPARQGNQTETTFDPGVLEFNTPYYWRIDEVNRFGTTTGDAWTFSTGFPGDFDNDGDVDQVDFGRFQVCLSGPGEPCEAGCHDADLDADEDVDQSDFSIFLACMTGANVSNDPNCLN